MRRFPVIVVGVVTLLVIAAVGVVSAAAKRGYLIGGRMIVPEDLPKAPAEMSLDTPLLPSTSKASATPKSSKTVTPREIETNSH